MGLISFPNPVNEVSARIVAGGVVLLCATTLLLDQRLLLIPLAYGFVARVLTGPTLSPLGQLATRVIAPRLPVGAKLVPGPPKRFAQGIGATLSLAAAVLYFGFDAAGAADILVATILVAAALESVLGLCLGCTIFAGLMRALGVPESVCEECNLLSARGKGEPADELPLVGTSR